MAARGAIGWLQRIWADFMRDGGGLLAAAVAYGALFAVAPALLIVVVAARYALGREDVLERLVAATAGALGTPVAERLAALVDAYLASRADGVGVGLLGVLLLVWALGGMFARLQQAFGMLWHVRPRPDLTLAEKTKLQASRLLFALLPVALAALGGAAIAVSSRAASLFGADAAAVSTALTSPPVAALAAWAALVVLYRLLPYAEVRVADVAVPAAVAAVVWATGTFLFGLYLARGTGTAAGAAGSLFALLVWLNFSAAVLLLGCTACRLLAEKNGRGGPTRYAEHSMPHVDPA